MHPVVGGRPLRALLKAPPGDSMVMLFIKAGERTGHPARISQQCSAPAAGRQFNKWWAAVGSEPTTHVHASGMSWQPGRGHARCAPVAGGAAVQVDGGCQRASAHHVGATHVHGNPTRARVVGGIKCAVKIGCHIPCTALHAQVAAHMRAVTGLPADQQLMAFELRMGRNHPACLNCMRAGLKLAQLSTRLKTS